MQDNSIVMMDYLGNLHRPIYSAQKGDITLCERLNDKLYLVEGNYLVYVDLNAFEFEILYQHSGISRILPLEEEKLIWCDGQGQFYLLDVENAVNTLLSESELNSLISIPASSEAAETDMILPSSVSLSTTQEQFPFSDFPSGTSYFTKNGAACTDHHIKYNGEYHIASSCNCRRYGAAYQCMGFAYYASDRYAHILGTEAQRPSVAANDRISSVTLYSDAQMREYFGNLTTGAYIRFSMTSTSGEGDHSMVLVSSSSTGITVYDCNWDNQCGVQIRFMSYSAIRTKYPYICYGFSHTYNGLVVSVSNISHRVHCSSNSCGAYIIEPHSFPAFSSAVCDVCGYTAN